MKIYAANLELDLLRAIKKREFNGVKKIDLVLSEFKGFNMVIGTVGHEGTVGVVIGKGEKVYDTHNGVYKDYGLVSINIRDIDLSFERYGRIRLKFIIRDRPNKNGQTVIIEQKMGNCPVTGKARTWKIGGGILVDCPNKKPFKKKRKRIRYSR